MPNTIVGVVTVYLSIAHAGNPLACGGVYADFGEWVAVDPGFANCGDVIGIWAGGVYRQYPALDTGPLSRYCVQWGDACLPIGADVPEHLWRHDGISARAVVTNETRARVEFERRAGRWVKMVKNGHTVCGETCTTTPGMAGACIACTVIVGDSGSDNIRAGGR